MKRLFILTVGIFITLCFQYTALGASASPIAVVDIQRLQNQSKAFQKERAKLKNKFEAMQEKLKAEEETIRKLEEDYNKQSMMLSLDAKQDKKRELERRKRHYKYLYEDFTKEMKDEEQDATKVVGKDLEKILENIAQKQGFILILERRTIGLVYYADAIDITDQVTQAYDKMHQ
ncbi:MAG: OmpH family outer membrane protein [Deltaproteobacteria bacterium]|nr:MAG: OmpH family outer membrane protein [Deltaproteobacteria bacterium]